MGKSVLYDALLTSKSLEGDTESGRTRRKDASYSLGVIWAPFSTKGDIATIKSADSQEKGKGKKSKKGEGKGSPQANAGKDADATASPEKEKKDKPVPKDGEKKKGNKNESMDPVQGEVRDLRNLLNDIKGRTDAVAPRPQEPYSLDDMDHPGPGGKFPRLSANAPSFNRTLNVNAPSFKMPPLPPDAPQDASASASAPPP